MLFRSRLYGALRTLADVEAPDGAAPDEAFVAALCDDLNTPKAMAELFRIGRQAAGTADPSERRRLKGALLASGELLGILRQDCERWFAGEDAGDAAEIGEMLAARARARAEKRFDEADRIRDALAARGVALEDGTEGTKWRRA